MTSKATEILFNKSNSLLLLENNLSPLQNFTPGTCYLGSIISFRISLRVFNPDDYEKKIHIYQVLGHANSSKIEAVFHQSSALPWDTFLVGSKFDSRLSQLSMLFTPTLPCVLIILSTNTTNQVDL